MGKVDGLSRRLDWKVGVDKDNENQIFIKDNWICSIQEVVIEGPEVDIIEKIKKARSRDENVVRIVEEMKKTGVKELQGNEWQIEGELVLKEEKVYVQKDMKRQADKERKEMENWKKGDKVMLSTKNLVFKEQPVRKLVD